MRKTKEKIKKFLLIIFIALAAVIILAVVVFMPCIIDNIYDCPSPATFFEVDLSKSDILNYYAQALSLLATIILGVIAVIQTYRSQKKSDEINALQLSIAQRELAVVEKQYEEEIEAARALAPKFEIKLNGYSGNYSNIGLDIRNISETMISAFRSISFKIEKATGEEISVTRWKVKFQSIASFEMQRVEMFTPDMRGISEKIGEVTYWENVKFIWKFSCEDCKGNKHFYAASILIPTTKDYVGDFWTVTKIG